MARKVNPASVVGLTLLHSLTAGLVNAALGPRITGVAQTFWDEHPILPPDPGTIISAWQMGFLSASQAVDLCRMQGVDYLPIRELMSSDMRGALNDYQRAWKAVQDAGLERPSPEELSLAYVRGRINADTYLRGMQRAGADIDDYNRTLAVYQETLGVGELLTARNRGLIDDDRLNWGLSWRGIYDDFDRKVMAELRHAIPSSPELVHYATNMAFNPEIAGPMGLYHEAPERLAQWHTRIGLGAPVGFDIDKDGAVVGARWFDLAWAAHWRGPAYGQVAEMLQRMRPGRMERFRAMGLDVSPFTREDAHRWLRRLLHPPGVRDQLLAISYLPLMRRDITSGVSFGLRDRAWAIEQYQDRGAILEDAEFQADLAVERQRREYLAPIRRVYERAVGGVVEGTVANYRLGIAERDDTARTLTTFGQTEQQAAVTLQDADMDLSRELVEAAIRAVRCEYLRGGYADNEAIDALTRSGIRADAAQRYVELWTLQRTCTRRTASTAQIMRWVTRGLMTPDEARRRLVNLGWDQADILLQFQDAIYSLSEIQARRQAQGERAQRRQAKELEQLSRRAQTEREKIAKRLAGLTPRAKLTDWLTRRLIGRLYFRRRMEALGYTPDVIARYERDAISKRKPLPAAAPAPTAAPGPPGPPASPAPG